MRINKFISHNTKYSRKEADNLIKQGLVKINSKIAQLGDSIKDDDKLYIKGTKIAKRTKFSVIMYHKQRGELVSKKDDRGRKIIYDSLPKGFSSWVSVGRLDFTSEGLLLLSDSVSVANALINSDLEREYYLKIKGQISEKVILAMQEGIKLHNEKKGAHAKTKITSMKIAPFLDYEIFGYSGGFTKLRVIINEGKNRELRRFFGHFDLEVMDLKRVAFGVLELGMLKPGKYRFLENNEYEKLRDFLRVNNIKY
ncbi:MULTISPECIES: pseudouridine synthase [unclassified Campylobacter]|uniref:pseudouridine synthase n=1 Tax=unclassified Campylobacter TaxID=2593542 RepID=UPI0012381D83|nr:MULTISPECIES: pseudouridine synthase [unclassified Campylobacter]KAA6224592.1 rRNA pseudouridine synthase [Campylobacter sp. LR185c]KAA6224834.1 rRNA pseudouridine synthase [Campylobacter sp. LR286c]KAA6227981.1 rRNA pseudouridine synthase [Campylobacter sp. LR196d]KAA6233462.1 rRNA pseudouridine synthase [Campylobacter sp. LR291e]KAA6234399.1 rRNA pseudouridine synthase [Campylobacter sp. LR264d]